MTLRLYDTAARSVREFVPLRAGRAGIYQCGLTVQSPPHIGHLRSGVNYDVLRRWLAYNAYEVTLIRNITDIDDKVLVKAMAAGVPFWSLAYAHERILDADYAALGVLPPTYEPRATGHVPEMQVLIERLIARGHAYPAGGDVYFDVRSWPAYGELSGQRLDAMQPCEDSVAAADPQAPGGADGKRDVLDFALWKGEKPTEPADAYWPSPWGRGRPGWHIECSAMTWRYLGEEFDIHGGGLDIQFPHHENEVAQSKAAGFGFARWWVHNAMVNLGGGKMAKSLGNVVDVRSVAAGGVRPVELRYYLLQPHYRSIIEYSEESLREAGAAYRRIEGFVQRAGERVGADTGSPVLCADFAAAMDDDLNTSRAVAAIHEVVRVGNAALADEDDTATRGALASVRAMLGILGLDPLDPMWRGGPATGGAGENLRTVVDQLVALALEQREAARARRDWPAADAVRDQLKQAGVLVEDTPRGTRWTLASDGPQAH